MTREEAKQLLPIIKAFSEGEIIQYRDNGVWKDITTEDGFYTENVFVNVNDCRIKPKSIYYPFANTEECWQEMLNHQPFGWIKDENGNYFQIVLVADGKIYTRNTNHTYNDANLDFKFADGTPFGVKVKEE